MIIEYDYVVTVELQTETRDQQAEARKKFKRELFAKYGGNEEMRITNIALERHERENRGVLSVGISRGGRSKS